MPTRNPLDALHLWPASGRIVALDYGARRIGVAVSDSGRRIASVRTPILVNPAQGGFAAVAVAVLGVIRETGAVAVIVGLPLNMDGSYGPTAQAAQSFAAELERRLAGTLAGPVLTWDERLTSRQAEQAFFEQRDAMGRGGREGRRQTRASKRDSVGKMDSTAAVVMLQSFLERLG